MSISKNKQYDYKRCNLSDDYNFQSLINHKETILTKYQADELMKSIDISNFIDIKEIPDINIKDTNVIASEIYKNLLNNTIMSHKSLVDE